MKICDNCKEEIKGTKVPGNYWVSSKAPEFCLCKVCYDAAERDGELPTVFNKTEHSPVNHPKHYNSHPSGVECITITRHMSFNIGNAIKYLWRAGMKDSEVQDLEKAVWYIKDEIQRLKK